MTYFEAQQETNIRRIRNALTSREAKVSNFEAACLIIGTAWGDAELADRLADALPHPWATTQAELDANVDALHSLLTSHSTPETSVKGWTP